MGKVSRSELAHDVLGSAHILASAVDRLVEERLQAVSKEQLTSSQLRLLRLIARTDVCRICQVATFLRVSPAATSKAVDRLVRRGLVRRREAEADRRRAELRLTGEGLNLLAQCEVIADQVLEEVFGAISADGLRQAADLLDRCCVSVLTRDSAGAEACFRCSSYFREKCLLWRSGGRGQGLGWGRGRGHEDGYVCSETAGVRVGASQGDSPGWTVAQRERQDDAGCCAGQGGRSRAGADPVRVPCGIVGVAHGPEMTRSR